MKILVTGSTSGLGRNATEWLLAAGHQAVAAGRDLVVGKMLTDAGADFRFVDLDSATPAQLTSLVQGCDAVWHCAAKSSPWGKASDFLRTNVDLTDRLALAAGQAGVPRFVHISTPAVYFDFRHHADIDESYRAKRFANHYSRSKFLAEGCITQRQQQFPATRFTVLRPRGLFGAHDRVIVPRILEQIRLNKGVLRLPRGGETLLDLTFSLNVVEAMWQATAQPHLPPAAVYNITNQQPERLGDMLHQLLNEQLGIRFTLRPVPYRLLYGVASGMELLAQARGREPLLTRYSVGAVNYDMTLSQTRAISELHYRPVYSMQQAIGLTAQAMRENKGVHRG